MWTLGPVLESEYYRPYALDFLLYVTRPVFKGVFDSIYWSAYTHMPVTPWAGLKACYMNDPCNRDWFWAKRYAESYTWQYVFPVGWKET